MAPAAPPQEPSALPTTTAADAAAVPVPQSAVPQPAKASSGELDGRKAAGGAFTKKWTARLFGKAEPEAHPTETETAAAAEAAAAAAAESSAPRQLEVSFTVRGEEGGGEGGSEGGGGTGGGGGGEAGGGEGERGEHPRAVLCRPSYRAYRAHRNRGTRRRWPR